MENPCRGERYHIAPALREAARHRETIVLTSAPTQTLTDGEKRDLAFEALALARRAERGGLSVTAYLLELAALEAGVDIAIGRSGSASFPRPKLI